MWAVTYSRHAKMPIINLRRSSNVLRAHCERAMLLISSKSPFAKWSPLHSAWERDSARRETVACVSVHVRMMAKPYMHVVTTNLHPTRLNSSSIIHRVSLPRNESVRVFSFSARSARSSTPCRRTAHALTFVCPPYLLITSPVEISTNYIHALTVRLSGLDECLNSLLWMHVLASSPFADAVS